MKIQIENNDGIKVMVESPHDNGLTHVAKISEMMRNVMTSLMISDMAEDTEISKPIEKPVTQEAPVVAKQEDRMIIRPRIPNNVVDIKELTIEKAVTENALVRCPKCGQAHCLAVPSGNHIYLMRRDYQANEFGIIAEFDSLTGEDFVNVCCKPETDRQAYYQDLQSFSFKDDVDFAVNNDTEIFCPVCHMSHAFSDWKNAFENPLDYFETETLCDACGGEKLEKFIKKRKIYQCDKCGLQSDFKERGE